MHMMAAVVVGHEDPDELERALAPYQENYDEEADALNGFWDWWQIGGRYTGQWSGYDPSADPANTEPCPYCHATGTRTDMVLANGCNGCDGSGVHVKWPTSWVNHPGDLLPVSMFLDGDYVFPWTVVTPEGAIHRDEIDPEPYADLRSPVWIEAVREALEHHRGRALVIVDYHS